ncbi:MAG: cytochrome c [Gammaproteobacteria bacterium]
MTQRTGMMLRGAVLAMAAAAAMTASAAPDLAAEKAKACAACHGANGISTSPLFPHLAGQPAIYLAKQLQAFRSGERRNEMMDIIARSLSDEDIRILSEYFESLPACAGQPQ